ncbi:MAG: hypothetical protein K2N94_14985, partial [Lachnospiraceae bacterium]|nr:hypothetical protein [Lachnospiraceae bacterium]
MKDAINREFAQRGIASEAKLACEYVIGLTDESWRDAIEAYLGKRRYTILVEPEYYEIADDVLNRMPNCYAHLFNTALLMKKELVLEEDSVVRYIEVKNPVARQYFVWQLGRFHAAQKEQVRRFENAISKEGRVSVAMDSYHLRFDRIRFYCLGQETIELNRLRAQKQLEGLKEQCGQIEERLRTAEAKKQYLETARSFFGPFNFDACRLHREALLSCGRLQDELRQLEEAQKNNMEYMELAAQAARLQDELNAVQEQRDNIFGLRSDIQTKLKISRGRFSEEEKKLPDLEKRLEEYSAQNSTVYQRAVEDYERHLENGAGGAGGILKDRSRAERSLQESRDKLTEAQAGYNQGRSMDQQLPVSRESRADYETRKSKIWMDDLQEIQQEVKKQTGRYEEIFKNEFVLTVLKSCESAMEELRQINLELSRLKFKARYEFSVRYVKDGSDYER